MIIYSMKQPDLCYFEAIKLDGTSLVRVDKEYLAIACILHTKFDKAFDVICMVSN